MCIEVRCDSADCTIGRTADAVSQLERGLSLPSLETLERLSTALDVPIQDIFGTDQSEKGGVLRNKLMTVLVDMARQMTDKELQVAVQVLEAVATKRTRVSSRG